jgi:hypothetical protein
LNVKEAEARNTEKAHEWASVWRGKGGKEVTGPQNPA